MVDEYGNDLMEDVDEVIEALGETINRLRQQVKDLRAENQYLTYFHREADFGPGHTDVVMAIQAEYAKTYGVPVPEEWVYE